MDNLLVIFVIISVILLSLSIQLLVYNLITGHDLQRIWRQRTWWGFAMWICATIVLTAGELFIPDIEKEHDWMDSIDIFSAKHGDKVKVITKDGEVWNGDDYDKEKVLSYLKIGQEYTIDYVDIRDCKTDVYLIGIKGIAFNSCNLYSSDKISSSSN